MAESMIVGRGLVEILPDFRKWGQQLASDMKMAAKQVTGSVKPVEGAFRDSNGRLRAANGAFIREYENGWKGATKTVAASMVKVGKGATLVGLGVGVAAVKMAGDFQAETMVLQTAAGETTKGLAVVRQGILNLSQNTGTGIKNLTDGMYQIEKAGFRGRDGLKVLTAAAEGAREENAKLSDVTNAMTSIMASYHLKAKDSVRVMNGMKTAAGEGKITMEEFSGAMSTVLPIASANKIAFEQVAGAVATLTQHGTSAREATHELGATIRALASPNNVASREMARFGLSSVDVSQNLGKRGLTGTIDLLTHTILSKMGPSGKILLSAFEGTKQSAADARLMISKMPKELQGAAKGYLSGTIEADKWNATVKGSDVAYTPMLRNFKTLVDRSRGFSRELKSGGPAAKTYTDALKKMSGGAIGLNTILQLSGESFDGFKERVNKVGASFHHNSKDVEGWRKTQNLLNVQIDMAKRRMQVLMITIGTKLIPVVTHIVKLFTQHKTVTLALVVGMLSLIGVLSTAYVAAKAWAVISGIASAAMFAFNVATMRETESMAVLRTQMAVLWVQERLVAVWTAITSSAFWGLAAAILANPITWIVVAIVALVAGIVLLATKTKFFQTIWAATWGFIKKVFWGFVNWFKKNWQLITFTILTGGIGLAVAMIVRHWQGVKHAFSETINWVKHNWPLLLAILGGPIGLAVLYIVKHWKQISDGAKAAFHDTINFAVQLGKDLGSFFSKLPGQLGHFFSTLPGIVGHWFVVLGQGIAKFFTKILPDAAKAMTGAQTALLHIGEDLLKGFFKGAKDFFTKTVPGWAKSVWHGVVDYFKAVFGIHSPSTVMAALGVDLIKGLFQGMLKIAKTVTDFLATHIGKPIINLFTKTIPSGAKTFSGAVSGSWNTVRDHVGSAFSSMKRAAIDPLINLFNAKIPGAGKSMRDLIIGFVRAMVLHVLDGFGAIIHGATKLFGWVPGVGGKLKKASAAFDRFRDDVNRALGGIKDRHPTVGVGMKIMTGKDAGLVNIGGIARAKGGPIFGPGTETSDDVPAWLSKNEHVWTAKEVKAVGGHGAMMRLRMMALLGLLKGYSTGGEVKGYAQGGGVDVKTTRPSAGAISSGTSTAFGIVFRSALPALIKAFKDSYISNVGAGVGGGVKRWTGMVQSVLRQLHESLAWTPTVLRRMNQESGGNPTVVNRWDSNWKAGHPSVGLMQVIAGTFRAYAGRYRGVGPFMYGVSVNPTANTYAGLNYALHRYGSLAALNRPGGYDLGGLARHVGLLFKGTNRPERVLSPRQTEAFERWLGHHGNGGGGGTVVQHYHLHTHGPIGSKHELLNWFVEMEDQVKRRKRS